MQISKATLISVSGLSLASLICANSATAQQPTRTTKSNAGANLSVKPTIQSHDALLVTGFQLVRVGRYKEAAECFNGAVKLSPNNWQDLFYRGKAYALAGDATKGIADLSQSIKLNRDNPYAILERGKLYFLGPKNYKAALTDLTDAIKLLPSDAAAHEYRGLVYSAIGKHGDAIDEFTNALALTAVNPPLSREAYAKKHFGEVNVEQAEKIKARLYYLRGKAKNDCKQFPAAVADLDYAIKLDSTPFAVYMERGKALTKVKNKELAIKDLERATALARTPEVYKTASALYLELGDRQRAGEAWKKGSPPGAVLPGSDDPTATSSTPAKSMPQEKDSA